MATNLPPVPYKSQVMDQNGLTTSEWGRFFELVRQSIQSGSGSGITDLTGDVTATGSGSVAASIASNVITNTMVNASAAIALTKLATVTTNKAIISNASGTMIASPVTSTELGRLSGILSTAVGISDTQTLTNKTLTAPAISSPTGIVKGDVGLGNVDNTSDATKNSAVATLTNKTLTGNTAANLISGTGTLTLNTTGTVTIPNATDTLVGKATTDTLTNKTLTSPVINTPTGIVKGDVGLGNVDNTSDATKNAAAVTLTNKTIAAGSNTISGLTNTHLSGSAGITNANLANVSTATFKGRTTAGTGSPEDLTVTQATALLNAMVGDSGSGGTKGLAPAPSSGDASAGKFLKADATWSVPAPAVANLVVTAVKTTTYAILATDDVVLVDGTSASFTTTLPTAVGVSGKVYAIKRVDQTLSNTVTIATTSSQTIDGVTTRKLCTQYEMFRVASDGSNWRILDHDVPAFRTSFTPTLSGMTYSSGTSFWWREGAHLCMDVTATVSAVAASEARLNFPTNVPASVASLATLSKAGEWARNDTATDKGGFILKESSVSYVTFGPVETFGSSSTNAVQKRNGNAIMAGTATFIANVKVPITGWEG